VAWLGLLVDDLLQDLVDIVPLGQELVERVLPSTARSVV